MRKFVILSLLVVLLISFTIAGMAADFVVEGGFLYTTLDYSPNVWIPDDEVITFNEYIDLLDSIDDFEEEDFIPSNSSKISDIDSATGYYIGVSTDVAGFDAGVNYESFSADESGFIEFELQEGQEEIDATDSTEFDAKVEASSELDISGFVFNFGRPINDYFSWKVGLGRYSGTLEEELIIENQGESVILEYDYDVESDFGYKIGLKLDYGLNNNWNFTANANYRILELDYEIDSYTEDGEEVAPNGFQLEESGSIDLDGFEITAGLSYSF